MKVTSPKRQWRVFIVLFFLVNVFLSTYFLDIWPTPNCTSRALTVLAFSKHRTLCIDPYAQLTFDKSQVREHFYSDKAPLPALLTIPFYEMLKSMGLLKVAPDAGKKYPVYIVYRLGVEDWRDYMIPEIIPILILGGFICGSLPFVFIVLMSFYALHRMKPSLSPVMMSMMAWYGSFIFVFSGTFFSHVFAGFLLLSSFILLRDKWYFVSGFVLGLGFLSEYPVIVAAPFWLLGVWMKEKKIRPAGLFLLGVLPSLFLVAGYNWWLTGTPWKMLNAYHAAEALEALHHHYGFSKPSLKSIWGLSFSGWNGLFTFAPMLYCIAFCVGRMMIKGQKITFTPETKCLAGFGIVFFLVISSFFTWWGGWSYGPRYLIVLAVLLLYEGMLVISQGRINRMVFAVTVLFGVIGAWLAKATLVYMVPFPEYDGFFNSFLHILLPDLLAGRFNANNALTAFWNVSPRIGVYSWLFFYALSVVVLYRLYQKWFVDPERYPSVASSSHLGDQK